MSGSRRDVILDAMVAALGASTAGSHTKPTGLTIHRHRTVPLAQDQLPAQVVYAVSEEVTTGPARGLDNKRLTRRKLLVCVETRVDATGNTPDQALDPYLTWVAQALCRVQSLTNGMHDITEHSTVWDADEQNFVYAAARTLFLVDYVSAADDPNAVTAG